MTTTQSTSTTRATPSLRPFLTSGLIGGLVAAAVNAILYFAGAAIAGGELTVVLPGSSEPAALPLISVFVMSIVPGILAGAAYWGLHRFTGNPTRWLLVLAGIAFLAFLPGPFNVASGATVAVLEVMHIGAAVPILWFVLRQRR